MKLYESFLVISLIFSADLKTYSQPAGGEVPVLQGAYLGQKPPGTIPEPFLPGVFKNVHSSPAFSHDGKYLFFIRNGKLMWVSAQFIEELKKM